MIQRVGQAHQNTTPTAQAAASADEAAATYLAVARLHVANLEQGFLSTLGEGFLAVLYRCMDEGDDTILIVERDQGVPVGFVTGTLGRRPLRSILARHWWRVLWTLLPSLLHPQRLLGITRVARYANSGAPQLPNLPSAELLSIVVSPDFRGRGHAERLFRRLEQRFKQHGIQSFRIVVGASLAPAHRFYQRVGAHLAGEFALHGNIKSIVYTREVDWESGSR